MKLREFELTKNKKVIKANSIPLKLVNSLDLFDQNMALYLEEKGNWFFAAGVFMLWLFKDEGQVDKLNKGETDMLLFAPGRLSFDSSPIDDIWKKNSRLKNSDKVVAAIQGWYDKDKKSVYINMLSVRPGWRRNGIATHMMHGLSIYFKGCKFSTSKTTSDGKAFFDSMPGANRPISDE